MTDKPFRKKIFDFYPERKQKEEKNNSTENTLFEKETYFLIENSKKQNLENINSSK